LTRRVWTTATVAAALTAALLYLLFGLYTIQPIGALPSGSTVLVRRHLEEPFFRSPDVDCPRVQGCVNLLCRAVALAHAPTNHIVLRLPHLHWAYLASAGGREFDE